MTTTRTTGNPPPDESDEPFVPALVGVPTVPAPAPVDPLPPVDPPFLVLVLPWWLPPARVVLVVTGPAVVGVGLLFGGALTGGCPPTGQMPRRWHRDVVGVNGGAVGETGNALAAPANTKTPAARTAARPETRTAIWLRGLLLDMESPGWRGLQWRLGRPDGRQPPFPDNL
jgi:hypothetical protein